LIYLKSFLVFGKNGHIRSPELVERMDCHDLLWEGGMARSQTSRANHENIMTAEQSTHSLLF